jgi:hypothetical protein
VYSNFSIIGGGSLNTASGAFSFVGGGNNNTASGYRSAILGGSSNSTNSLNCAMIVGSNITANRACTTFVNDMTIVSMAACSGCGVGVSTNGLLIPVTPGGGSSIMVVGAGLYSTIRTGVSNQATGCYGAALSGYQNRNYSNFAIIGGGCGSIIYDYSQKSFIGGGTCNTIYGANSTTLSSYCSVIGGGSSNSMISSKDSFIGGGGGNLNYGSNATVIGGGAKNCNIAGSTLSTIGGGLGNAHNGSIFGFIGGGYKNVSTGPLTSIGGGSYNITTTYNGVIGGGYFNRVYGVDSSILGGVNNLIGAAYPNSHIIGSNRTANAANTTFVEYLSKLGGTFSIPHPNPDLTNDFLLNHSFVETPTAGDNIYRFTVKADDKGKYTVNLPDYFPYLNGDVQVWVTCANGFGLAFGIYESESNTISVNTSEQGTYNILVIGTRIDNYTRSWQGAVTRKPRQ